MKRIFASSLALLACAGIFLAGCESLNGPDSAADEALSLAESFDVTSLDGQASLLKSAGVNTDSANAFFVLRWSEGPGHFRSSDTVRGHASAVAYENPATLRDRNAVGLDMGTVLVVNGQDTFELPKLTSTLFGVRYGLFGGPHGGPKGPRGGPHGGRGGPHGHRLPNGGSLTIVDIPFVGGSNYEFEVAGSDRIAARALNIQAPSQLVQIIGLATKDTIDATQDITVAWQGDATANNMVLVLAPARKPGRFGGQPVEPVFISLDPAAGSYTLSAQTLQDLLSASSATALSLHLSQSVVSEITDAALGKILVGAGTDDRVLLIVQ